MKKILTRVSKIEVSPLGTLLLGMIFLVVHIVYFAFSVYGLLPLFYGIVTLVICVNIILHWLNRQH